MNLAYAFNWPMFLCGLGIIALVGVLAYVTEKKS